MLCTEHSGSGADHDP